MQLTKVSEVRLLGLFMLKIHNHNNKRLQLHHCPGYALIVYLQNSINYYILCINFMPLSCFIDIYITTIYIESNNVCVQYRMKERKGRLIYAYCFLLFHLVISITLLIAYVKSYECFYFLLNMQNKMS